MSKPALALKDAERELNEIGCQPTDLKSFGGRISDYMSEKSGTWLRRNDQTSFYVFYHERKAKINGGK